MAFATVNINLVLLLLGLVTVYGDFLPKIKYRFDYDYDSQTRTWLKYHFVPMTWTEARMQCHAEGAVLASPLTDMLKTTIVTFVKQKTIYNGKKGITIFSGVHSTYSKGVYSSIEGVPLLKLAVTWAPGEPDNKENSESCLVMMITDNGTMADARCDQALPFVCYMKDYNFNVNNECGTADHEYVLEPETGSCYKYHTKIMTWSEAYKICEAEGAYLAIMNTKNEAQVIKDSVLSRGQTGNFKSVYPNYVFIGFSDWSQSLNFMTIHGKSLNEAGFQKWKNDQVNNLTKYDTNEYGQGCGGFDIDGFLCDLYCNLPHVFICEMAPNSLR